MQYICCSDLIRGTSDRHRHPIGEAETKADTGLNRDGRTADKRFFAETSQYQLEKDSDVVFGLQFLILAMP